ncbi:hypothetical protein ACS0TY_013767 [Phlomoides rotata]
MFPLPPPPAVDVSEVRRTNLSSKRTSRRSPLPPHVDVPPPPSADAPPAVDGPLLKKQKLKSDPEDVKVKSQFQWSSRCRGLFELIQNFNQKQKSDIESVGFGGLLHLKLKTNPNQCMLRWLVDSFNPSSRMFQIDGLRGFTVTPDDVFDVFMLPRNPGVQVLLYAKSKFPNGGDDFIMIFVLYALLSFLDPSPNRLVITKYLKSLEVIQEISKFDWCSFILDKLCESIKRELLSLALFLCLSIGLLRRLVIGVVKSWKRVLDPRKKTADRKLGLKLVENSRMQEFFISLKNDANQFTDKYMTRLVEIGREVHVNDDNAESSSPPMDEEFFKSIDRLVEMFYLTKKLANQMPNFRILFPSPVDTFAYGWDRSVLEELVGGDVHREGGTDGVKAAEYYDSEREEEDVTPVGDAEISEAINSVGVKAKNVGVDYVESLIPGEWICQTIINSWSFIVNNDCWLDNGRKRFILSTDHSVLLDSLLHENLDVKKFELELKKFWNKWLNVTKDTIASVDMIFFPFCFLNHYAAVVINFLDRKIQYLDNRKYSDEDLEKNFTDVTNLLVSHMTSFLDKRKHPEADQIKKYDFEVVNFKWKTTKSNDDCGVFLMHHLKHFNGVVYDSPDLSKVTIRRVLRAEFCVSILLSNLNQCRPDLVDKVNFFYQNEPDLIARKSEARRKSKAARKVKGKKKSCC